MTYSIVMLVSRAPGVSVAAFTKHYEDVHMPLAVSILGDAAPTRHTRHYIQRDDDAAGDHGTTGPPPLLFVGDPATVTWDCVAVVEFEDEAHFARFRKVMMEEPRMAELREKDQGVIDMGRSAMVGVQESGVTVAKVSQ